MNLKFLIKQLKHQRLRTLLSILGIAISACSMMTILNLGEIGKFSFNNELDGMGFRGISVKSKELLDENCIETINNIDGVKDATPIISEYGAVLYNELNEHVYIWGIDENVESVITAKSIYGREISHSDVVEINDVCVIDSTLSEEMFGKKNSVGEKVQLTFGGVGGVYEIVGVCEADSGILKSVSGSLAPYFVYIPYSSMKTLENKSGFDWIAVNTANDDIEKICNNIDDVFSQKQMLVTTENLSSQRKMLDNLLSILEIVLFVISIVSLVVSGLSIMTVMMSSVNERTVEIGIKKAIGASKTNILAEFAVEALTISLIGAIIGCVVGTALSFAVSFVLLEKVLLKPQIILISLACSALIGLSFGCVPAIKASYLKPIDALNSD